MAKGKKEVQYKSLNLAEAAQVAAKIMNDLEPYCSSQAVAGSIRREEPEVHDIDLLVLANPSTETDLLGELVKESALEIAWPFLMDYWSALPISAGPKEKKFLLPDDIKVEVRISTPATWAVELAIWTGPETFSHNAVTHKSQGGYLPSNCDIKNGWLVYRGETLIPMRHERDFLEFLGLGWVEPKDRK
jgi:DNA polymerase/3'-5' exonuclease PolX